MRTPDKKTSFDDSSLLCEYAVMPLADCFCNKINGNSIPKVAKYCMEENSGCPVYKKITAVKIKISGKADA